MYKALLAGLVVLLLVLGFGAWLWRLGAPPTLAASVARLEEVEGSVEVRSDAANSWTNAVEGQSIQAGTRIRTGSTGTVTLTVSGVSQTRLSTSTEISVDTLVLPQTDSVKSQTGLTLVTGRTWSRIVRLLELDSSYTVTTDDVVATVRGTAFETARLPDKQTWIAVYDGKVNAGERVMEKGSGMMKAARGSWKFVSTTTMLPQNNVWLEKNVEADTQFLKDTQTELKEQLTKDVSGAYQLLGAPAERLHMALTDTQDKAALADKYLARQLAMAKELQDEGKVDAAKETFERVKTEMQAWASQVPLDKQAALFSQTMVQSSVLYHDLQADPTTLFLKEKMDALKADWPTIETKLPPLPVNLPTDLNVDPTDVKAPIVDPKTLIDATRELTPVIREKIDSIQPVPAVPPTDVPKEEFEKLIPESLQLYPSQAVIHPKELASITATVSYTNGSRRDVTRAITLVSSDPSMALVMGNTIQATDRPGFIRVTASFRENGVTVTSGVSFEIQH